MSAESWTERFVNAMRLGEILKVENGQLLEIQQRSEKEEEIEDCIQIRKDGANQFTECILPEEKPKTIGFEYDSSGVKTVTATEATEPEGESKSHTSESEYSDSEEIDEQLKIPKGFLQKLDKIRTRTELITANEVRPCVATCVYSPSEIYLVFAEDFPKNLNKFIYGMSDQYFKMFRMPRKSTWLAHGDVVEPGMNVAVVRPPEGGSSKAEYHRGIVLTKTCSDNPYNKNYRFEIRTLDLGEYDTFRLGEVFYLHEMFTEPPGYAVRCRFALSKYYNKYHDGLEEWPEDFNTYLLDMMYDRRFNVKFIRQVIVSGEPVWEISLEDFVIPHELMNSEFPIVKQLIRGGMGEYMDDNGELEFVLAGN